MKGIIDAAVSRARPVLLVLTLVLTAGSVAYVTIPKESDPDIAIPIIYVRIPHEGISPRMRSDCWYGRWNRSFATSKA